MRKIYGSNELILCNEKLSSESKEIEKLSAELIILQKNNEFQLEEKDKLVAEYTVARKALSFMNSEKDCRACELITANIELAFQNDEKIKRAAELVIADKALKKADKYLKVYFEGLEKIMYITSHKIRQPIAHILGISSLLQQFLDYPNELIKSVEYLKTSAQLLDSFTKELTDFIWELEQTEKVSEKNED